MIQEMHQYFYTRRTYPVSSRLFYLKKLKKVILAHQDDITHSLYLDLKKSEFEAYSTEIYTTISELNFTLAHLRNWTKIKTYRGSFPVIGSKNTVVQEPYGVCAIFSPFNYPFSLAITPLIGAIAAGNCVVIKPSEHTPYTNRILKHIIQEVFPSAYVTILEGGVKTAQMLLKAPIDYIFFTGGVNSAKSIMQAAAQHLIPVTLELGGKSPVIIDDDADLALAAKRIVWGKFLNSGQTCIAPDYVLVHENRAQAFLKALTNNIRQLYPHPAQEMTHIINESHYVRLLQLINEDKIYYGGHFDTHTLFIEPTILYPVTENDLCMKEEIFGPILPVLTYRTLSEAIKFVQRKPKPLAAYIFSRNKKHIHLLTKHLSFGGGCVNDTILHIISPHVPFGGVGYSGMGSYHGYYSFKTFSHEKTIFISQTTELPLRYQKTPTALYLLKKMIQ